MKNRVKRWISAVMCGCLAMGLTACGGSAENAETAEGTEAPVELTYSGIDLGTGSVNLEDTEVINYLEEKLNINAEQKAVEGAPLLFCFMIE